MHPDVEEILFSRQDIEARLRELGAEIAHDYQAGGFAPCPARSRMECGSKRSGHLP